jgi:hypothetical protein
MLKSRYISKHSKPYRQLMSVQIQKYHLQLMSAEGEHERLFCRQMILIYLEQYKWVKEEIGKTYLSSQKTITPSVARPWWTRLYAWIKRTIKRGKHNG